MSARLMPLAVAIVQLLPYAYCFSLGMVMQFVGGSK
jgi:hypothetical protein